MLLPVLHQACGVLIWGNGPVEKEKGVWVPPLGVFLLFFHHSPPFPCRSPRAGCASKAVALISRITLKNRKSPAFLPPPKPLSHPNRCRGVAWPCCGSGENGSCSSSCPCGVGTVPSCGPGGARGSCLSLPHCWRRKRRRRSPWCRGGAAVLTPQGAPGLSCGGACGDRGEVRAGDAHQGHPRAPLHPRYLSSRSGEEEEEEGEAARLWCLSFFFSFLCFFFFFFFFSFLAFLPLSVLRGRGEIGHVPPIPFSPQKPVPNPPSRPSPRRSPW